LDSAKQTSLRVLADASETAAPKLREAADRARPQVEALAGKAEEFAEKARPQVEALADRANDQVHEWADKLEAYRPEATERAGNKAMNKAPKPLASAGKKIEKDTARKSGRGKTALVWTLVIGSAAGVGYYVWKKAQPVEDPWSTPLPNNRPADARPVGSTPASRQSTAPQVSQTAVPESKSEDETPAPKTAVKPAEAQAGQADDAKH